jgi:hypothetical protein
MSSVKKYSFATYIHSNKMNEIPTRVARYSFEKHSPGLNIYIERLEDHPKLLQYHNQPFYRGLTKSKIEKPPLTELNWDSNKHQAFFPVRFLCCETHKANNRPEKWILVVDPDIFCLKNLEVLNSYIRKAEEANIGILAVDSNSSCMLINTEVIRWTEDSLIQDMFIAHNDFDNWMFLRNNGELIDLPVIFNQGDTVNAKTVMLHTTKTETQPWKSGIRYKSWEIHNKVPNAEDKTLVFKEHRSKKVKTTVFNFFKEAYENKLFSDSEIRSSIENRALRPDIKCVCNIR